MSQELLYTSAPKGLNPSDQGFCTVACTQGMPRNLKEVLENLSGYRQADQPPHPVNYSHLIHTVGGKRYQILSRVGDYEKDYSGRTNKLAHHVALTIEELPPSGPAALLNTPLFQSTWDGQTRSIPQGPVLPAVSDYQGSCGTWEAVTGDAGWAGILAESAADGSQRPMYVIFSAGQDTLALAREALGVLPRDKAWTTSFSTYFTKLPAGVDCLWRFVLDGSPEAQQARAASHSRAIDLPELERSRREAPAGNPYVEAARAGRVVEVETPAVVPPAMAHAAPSATPDTLAAPVAPSAAPASPFASTSPAAVPASPFGKSSGTTQKPSKFVFILGGVAGVLFLGVGVLVYSMLTREIPPPVVTTDDDSEIRESRPRDRKKFIAEKQKKKNELAQKTVPQEFIARVDPPENKPMQVETEIDMQPKIMEPWDKGLAKLNGYLPLPQKTTNLNTFNRESDAFATPKPVLLTEIQVADPKGIDLTIHSPNGSSKTIADAEQEGFLLETSDVVEPDGPSRRKWVVQRKQIKPVAEFNPDTNKFDKTKKHDVGFFELSDQELKFLWEPNPAKGSKYLSLQYCLLEIHHAGESQKLRLSKPKTTEILTYDLSSLDQPLHLGINSSAIADSKSLFLDMTVYVNDQSVGAKKKIGMGETATFPLRPTDEFPLRRTVEFDFTFQNDKDNGPFLKANTYASLPALASEKATSQKSLNPLQTFKNDLPKDLQDLEKTDRRLAAIPKDFDAFIKDATDIQNRLNSAKKFHQRQVAELPQQIKREQKDGKRAVLQRKLKEAQDGIEKYNEWIDVAAGWGPWANKMQPDFEDLADNTKIGYSIYTVIEGEKLVLAQSESVALPEESPPKKSREKSNRPKHKGRENDLWKAKKAQKNKSAEQSPAPPK